MLSGGFTLCYPYFRKACSPPPSLGGLVTADLSHSVVSCMLPELSALESAGKLRLPDGTLFSDVASLPQHDALLQLKSRSSKRNDLFTCYCKSIIQARKLRELLEAQGHIPETTRAESLARIAPSQRLEHAPPRSSRLTVLPPHVATPTVPNALALDNPGIFIWDRIQHFIHVLTNWAYWEPTKRFLSWAIFLFSIFQPKVTVQLVVSWILSVTHTLLAESIRAIYSIAQFLATPITLPTQNLLGTVNIEASNDSVFVWTTSILVIAVTKVFHKFLPARIPDVD